MGMSYHWNPLYPSNEEVDPLEEAAREAEWEDDMRQAEKRRKQKPKIADEDDSLEDLF